MREVKTQLMKRKKNRLVKQWRLLAAIICLLLIGVGGSIFLIMQANMQSKPTVIHHRPTPTTTPSPTATTTATAQNPNEPLFADFFSIIVKAGPSAMPKAIHAV